MDEATAKMELSLQRNFPRVAFYCGPLQSHAYGRRRQDYSLLVPQFINFSNPFLIGPAEFYCSTMRIKGAPQGKEC